MKRLLWKEWQERRVWLLLWAAAIIILGGLGVGQSPFGFYANFTGWITCAFILTLLAGLSGYGSELSGERAAFLYSRALCWWQVLLAKVLVGLVVIIAAPLIAAVAMRPLAPAPYLPFMTPGHLLQGAAMLSLWLGVLYLIGLGCSIVLPGLSGSIITLLGLGAATLLGGYLLHALAHRDAPVIMYLCAGVTALLTVIIFARFGVTLSPLQRLRRFGVVLLSVVAAGMVVELIPAYQRCENRLLAQMSTDQTEINPCGTMAYIQHYSQKHGNKRDDRAYLLSLAEQRALPFPAETSPYMVKWISNDYLLGEPLPPDGKIFLCSVEHGQIRTTKIVDLHSVLENHIIFSPDKHKILIGGETGIKVVNMAAGQVQNIIRMQRRPTSRDSFEGATFARCWWQSSEVVGYIDPANEQRVLVKVGG